MRFMGLNKEYSNKDSKIVILPVEYEGTVTYGKGCSKAPLAILKASFELEPYDDEIKKEVCYDLGIATMKAVNNPKLVYSRVKQIIDDGKFPVIIGGDHSISFPAFKAISEKYGKVSFLQFDAHGDLKYSFGSTENHACVARRIFPLCSSLVQFGVRSLDIDEHKFIEENKKIKTFLAKDIYSNDKWMDKAIKALDDNVYVSIDADGFEAGFINTGTPEPGGLSWYQVLKFLKKVSEKKKIVGFDVVEMIPKDEKDEYVCAKLVYKMISYSFRTNH